MSGIMPPCALFCRTARYLPLDLATRKDLPSWDLTEREESSVNAMEQSLIRKHEVMSSKATEKIIDALTQLVEGFAELQERLEEDYDPDVESDEETPSEGEEKEEGASNLEEALVTEVRAAVEAVIENEDCAPEDLASIVSALSDALEEIDPEVFAHGAVAEEEEEEEDEDYEDDDIDLDDEDEDEDEEDDEDEDEDDEDDDEDEDD